MILNTGSRTDIPSFYSEWFYNRMKEGFVMATKKTTTAAETTAAKTTADTATEKKTAASNTVSNRSGCC